MAARDRWARRTNRGSAPPPRSSARCAHPRRRPPPAPAPPEPPAPLPRLGETGAACPPPCASSCPPPTRSRPRPPPACPPAVPHPARPPRAPPAAAPGPGPPPPGAPRSTRTGHSSSGPCGGAEVLRVARAHQDEADGKHWSSIYRVLPGPVDRRVVTPSVAPLITAWRWPRRPWLAGTPCGPADARGRVGPWAGDHTSLCSRRRPPGTRREQSMPPSEETWVRSPS